MNTTITKTAEKSLCFTEFMSYMIDKDMGAVVVLQDMMHAERPSQTIETLNKLDELDIRGSKLWRLYQDECKLNIDTLFKKVEEM